MGHIRYFKIEKRSYGHHFYVGETVKIEFLDSELFEFDQKKNRPYTAVNRYGYKWNVCPEEYSPSDVYNFNHNNEFEKNEIIRRLVCLEFEKRNKEYCKHSNRAMVIKPHPKDYGMYEVENVITLETKYESMHEFSFTDVISYTGCSPQLFAGSWQEKFYLVRKFGKGYFLGMKIRKFLQLC